MNKLSIIVPCFNEEASIKLFYDTVEEVFVDIQKKWEFVPEYWFIDDGSSDKTLDQLRKLQNMDPEHVHYVSFSRNFGKEAALYAGLQYSTGDLVTVIDVDLQDPPELLSEMIKGVKIEGYDIVGCRREDRKGEPVIRSFFSNLFYKLINAISHTQFVPGVRDYRLMTRQVVNAILSVTENNRFSKGIFSWVGFKTKYLTYKNRDRARGKTSWSFWQLFNYSIEGIINFSEVPLSIATFTGILSCIIAIFGLCFIVIKTLIHGNPVAGWPSLVCIMLLIGGVQLFCLGIVGKYVGKIYLESKNRPIYIIKEEK